MSFPPSARLLRVVSAAIVLCVATGAVAADDEATGTPIPAEELAARIASGDAPLILDVRTPGEFADGHLPGARNLPHDTLADRLNALGVAKSDEIVVHCHSGRRAEVAESILREAGYTNVRDLTGHWQEWKRAGLPTE